MLILIILPLLISGYCVQQWNYNHFYQLHRHTGQLLYLKSAFLGSICLALAFILSYILLSIKPIKLFYDLNLGFDALNFLSEVVENKFLLNRKSLAFYIFLTSNIFIVAFIWSYGSNFTNILARYFYVKEKNLSHS